MITAAQLYDHVACPHRVHLDHAADPAARDAVSPFVQLLWDRGSSYETQLVNELGEDVTLISRQLDPYERERLTLDAMAAGANLIHGGRICFEDLVGEPDLLIRRDDRYMAADIKSGRADEDGGEDDETGRPKAPYAVQVALYANILDRIGHGCGHLAEIWDGHGRRVTYDLDRPRHSRTDQTWWDFYLENLTGVRDILSGVQVTRGAMAAGCKLCHWKSRCREELTSSGDLTLVPQLGRAIRDGLIAHVTCIGDFAAADPETLVDGKKTKVAGLGPDRLRLFHRRARLLVENGEPFLRVPVELPDTAVEIYFDIEADPMSDIVYLHGFLERTGRDAANERFTAFFAEGPGAAAERAAFEGAMNWLRARADAAIYYYSKYERTMYRKLCQRHPGVCTADEIEELFTPPRAVDLFCDVVQKATEWPTNDHSIKTLAKFLGFSWRDTDPSGAASIEWFQRWLKSGDPAIRQRILDYNEDDCRATGVLLDGIRSLRLHTATE